MLIGAELRTADQTFEHRSPIDTDLVVSRFPLGTRADVRDAIAAARAAFPAWRDLGWRQRLEIIRRAADLISERQFEYAALMTFEVGKNRLEALGDGEETAYLLRYYGQQVEEHDGRRPWANSPAEAHPLDPQAARRVGDTPLQLPHGLAGSWLRARWSRAARWSQAIVRRPAHGLEVRRGRVRRGSPTAS
jgi:acyl-CoA reductase-like NAD-dependent aldehyde dehydrogenase